MFESVVRMLEKKTAEGIRGVTEERNAKRRKSF